jgi:hypothetical protein
MSSEGKGGEREKERKDMWEGYTERKGREEAAAPSLRLFIGHSKAANTFGTEF